VRARQSRPSRSRSAFSMPLTGGLASNGKAILAAYQMWEEDINAKGGLLGRPVKLIYYDDQSNPSLVPAIYAKLLVIAQLDLAFTSYGTNLSVPSMPVVIPRNYVLLGLFALAVNSEFNYPYYFSMFRQVRMPCTSSRAAISRSPRNRSCRPLPSPAPIRISP